MRANTIDGGRVEPYTATSLDFLTEVDGLAGHDRSETPSVAAQALRNALATRYGIDVAVDALCAALALCVADQEPGGDAALVARLAARIGEIAAKMRGNLS